MEENSMQEMLMDISKDTDKILSCMKDCKMSDNAAMSYMMGANANRGYGTEAAMWMNNPFLYLIMLAMFGNGGWGGWGNNGAAMSAASSAEATNLLMNAINSAGATSQRDLDRLANSLGVSSQTLTQGLATINTSLAQIAGQIGTNSQQVINAIQTGNTSLMQQLQSCCCENRLAICQQTNALQTGQFQLGVTIQQQGDMTRALIREQSFEGQIRSLTRENEQLRDAAQTATLQNTINTNNATIVAQLTAIQTQLQNQITAQSYQIQTLADKASTASA